MRRGITRLIGIEATSKGFCFAVLEDTERLIDWGGREVKPSTGEFIDKFGALIDRYRPDIVVIEDPAGSRKSRHVKEWLVWAEEYAHQRRVLPIAVFRDDFHVFTSRYGSRKHHLAVALARFFPELETRVPPPRQPWESEKWRTSIFVALGRALLVAQQRQFKASRN